MRLPMYRLLAPADDAGALAAMSAGIAEAAPAAAGETHVPDSQASAGDGTDPSQGQGDEQASAGGAGEGDAEAAAAVEAEAKAKEANEAAGTDPAAGDPPKGHERDAKTGKFVKKAATAAADPAGKKATPEIDPATGKPKVAVAAKKADHVNDPIADDIKGRTRERMEGLVGVAKQLTSDLTAAKAELVEARELVTMIDATGADAETFGRHMNVLALMHSPKLEDKQAVLGYLRKAAEKLGIDLGEPAPGATALQGHQDLIDEVEGGELTQKRAEEIATQRNRDKAAMRISAEARTRETAQTAEQQAAEQVKNGLNALSTELRARDGDAVYGRKHVLLVPMIRSIHRTLAPEKVLGAVRAAYEALKLGPAATAGPAVGDQGVAARAAAGTGASQPLRARQGAGAGPSKEPKTALEAMDFGLEQEALNRGRG